MDLQALYAKTRSPRVLPVGGATNPFFRLDFNEKLFAKNYKDPVLIAASSSLPEKLKLALQLNQPQRLGQDLVAGAVNDLVAHAAEPLFFHHHLALPSEQLSEQILQSISDTCLQTPCALLGGQLQQSPEPSLTGFALAVIEKNKILKHQSIEPGDSVLGLSSAGPHTAGFHLINDILQKSPTSLTEFLPALNSTLAEELLKPTHLYASAIRKLLATYKVKRTIRAMAHITTSLPEALPKMLPESLSIRLKRDAWPIPPIFNFLQSHFHLPAEEMLANFNMGIGFVLIVRPTFTKPILAHLRTLGEKPHFLGKIKNGNDPKLEWA